MQAGSWVRHRSPPVHAAWRHAAGRPVARRVAMRRVVPRDRLRTPAAAARSRRSAGCRGTAGRVEHRHLARHPRRQHRHAVHGFRGTRPGHHHGPAADCRRGTGSGHGPDPQPRRSTRMSRPTRAAPTPAPPCSAADRRSPPPPRPRAPRCWPGQRQRLGAPQESLAGGTRPGAGERRTATRDQLRRADRWRALRAEDSGQSRR